MPVQWFTGVADTGELRRLLVLPVAQLGGHVLGVGEAGFSMMSHRNRIKRIWLRDPDPLPHAPERRPGHLDLFTVCELHHDQDRASLLAGIDPLGRAGLAPPGSQALATGGLVAVIVPRLDAVVVEEPPTLKRLIYRPRPACHQQPALYQFSERSGLVLLMT